MPKGVSFVNNKGPVTIKNDQKMRRSSVLGKLIEIIASANTVALDLDRIPADTEEKIKFNDLNKYQWVVEEFIGSSLQIDESIEELNQTILNGSTKLKRQMKLFYFKSLSKYSIGTAPFNLEKLQFHSDAIVEDVIALVTDFVHSSSDLGDGYFEEDIEHGAALITSYSIIECIVLENPNDHC